MLKSLITPSILLCICQWLLYLLVIGLRKLTWFLNITYNPERFMNEISECHGQNNHAVAFLNVYLFFPPSLKLTCRLAMWCLLAVCQKALLCATLRKRQVIVADLLVHLVIMLLSLLITQIQRRLVSSCHQGQKRWCLQTIEPWLVSNSSHINLERLSCFVGTCCHGMACPWVG